MTRHVTSMRDKLRENTCEESKLDGNGVL